MPPVSTPGFFQIGDRVQLTDPKGKLYSFTITPGKEWHTHKGWINHDDLVGLPEGSVVSTTAGLKFTAFIPLLADYVLSMPRGATIVYPKDAAPTIVLFTQSKPGLADAPMAKVGLKVLSIEDQRWGRRDIKTVQLLYPSMGKMMAKAAGCDDAWMVEDGHVTEGTSNNAYIVKGNTIVTRHLGHEILSGITRTAVLRFAREAQMVVEERPFSIDEAKAADEAFITSASAFVMPVVELDGQAIGTGKPGSMTARLREIYLDEMRKAAV